MTSWWFLGFFALCSLIGYLVGTKLVLLKYLEWAAAKRAKTRERESGYESCQKDPQKVVWSQKASLVIKRHETTSKLSLVGTSRL